MYIVTLGRNPSTIVELCSFCICYVFSAIHQAKNPLCWHPISVSQTIHKVHRFETSWRPPHENSILSLDSSDDDLCERTMRKPICLHTRMFVHHVRCSRRRRCCSPYSDDVRLARMCVCVCVSRRQCFFSVCDNDGISVQSAWMWMMSMFIY